ncbi:MAG TPA: hypothetical protein VFW65_24975 [Pseudonocardiaceae bacterium]|nr:hypothetical protein [Pseudonocardiaceae bacterium]
MTHTVTTSRPADLAPVEEDALDQLVTAAAAIEDEWARGVREVEQLEWQAERVRDDVRERTAALEDQQAEAIVVLYRTRSIEDLAQLLGMTLDDALPVVRKAEERVVRHELPRQRTA